MADELHPDGEMIEIGDLTDETEAPPAGGPEAPPRVVIEYRERGVPWMLIPPLLALSAVLAAVGTSALRPEPRPIARPNPAQAGPILEIPPAPIPVALPNPAPTPPPVEPATAPAPAPAPAVAAAEVPEAPPATQPEPAAPTFPRVVGLGFDPEALKAEAARAEAPVDPAVATAGDKPVAEPLPTFPPEGARPQATEIDPNLLPPDPRLARKRQLERIAEAKRKAEDDRFRFHAELEAILRKQGDRSGPAIQELCLSYGMEVDPVIKKRAARLLGEFGMAAGASRPVRINILREEGFPEAAILHDIIDTDTAYLVDKNKPVKELSKAVRGGPRSVSAVQTAAARSLLSYPPRRSARPATARASSESSAPTSTVPAGPSR